jgi:hypothetical protein
MYYYDPSGALVAAEYYGSGNQGLTYSGACSVEAGVCSQVVDAGCASGSEDLDSGSAESAAD